MSNNLAVRPDLCANLTLDFPELAKAHLKVGKIWRVAAIVSALALTMFSFYLVSLQSREPVPLLEAVWILGALGGLALLSFRCLWNAGTSELEESQFYHLVAKKEREISHWNNSQVDFFFLNHGIDFLHKPTSKKIVPKWLQARSPYLRLFLPAIAHFKTLQADPPGGNSPISLTQRALKRIQMAIILQSMHRPFQNRGIELGNRFTYKIPGIGKFDQLGAIRRLHEGKPSEAFFFEGKRKGLVLTIDQLNTSTPAKIRAMLFG